VKKIMIGLWALVLVASMMVPALAQEGQAVPPPAAPLPVEVRYAPAPSGGAMIFDFLIVRPVSFVGLAIGTGISIAATPFALASKSTGPVYERLVVEPFNFAVRRPLGEF